MVPPLVEAFLVVDQPRQRLGHWLQTLAALDDRRAPPLAAISAYYEPEADQALIALRYDELALGAERLGYIVEIALLAEIGMIQPHELSDGDRKRFLSERLARCTLIVADQRNLAATMTELARMIKDQRLAPRTHVGNLPPRPAHGALIPAAARIVDPAPPDRPPLPRTVSKQRALTPPPRPVPTGDDEPILLVQPKSTRDLRDDELPQPRTRTPNLIPRSAGGSQPLPRTPLPTDNEPTAVRPTPPEDVLEAPPVMIHARYLRGGRWVAARVGALSLRGGALLSGALPRLGDHVDVALAFDAHRTLVRGPVTKVSSADEVAASGTATFSVAFELDPASKRQLAALLTAARSANVTIKPPPSRQDRRFPVDWPVCLGTPSGAIRAEALDVSNGGMFVRPVTALDVGAVLNFSVILDDALSPVAGRARVARQVRDAEASACGFVPGFGLHIVEMSPADRARWSQFVARIERRAEKRVLVGASPERLAELQAHLAAAGYAVTGGTDPGALVQLAGTDTRPVDVAIIDAGFTQTLPAAEIESVFAARSVPCLTHHGDARRARQAVDRVLSVGGVGAGTPTSRS
ncbi:MAG: PilZ domain-containing protein [Deltaproteobacteria bacterium]|nr:PilZ domain-containing protein [Deltaproteobacteria bacterium]